MKIRVRNAPKHFATSTHHTDANPDDGLPTSSARQRIERFGPLVLVIAPIVFSSIELRSEIRYTPMLNDSAFHSEMVRYATTQLRNGHFPLGGWFPFLNLGSPLFVHYQSLGAMVAGVFGLAIGANSAFKLSLYVLLATWPISVYLGARLFRFSRWAAAFAALASPFIVSTIGLGYEQAAYLWVGFGVWSQLWAMWTLPLAWGFSWRAVDEGTGYLPAALFVALTAAFHFETGYLAFLAIAVWLIARPAQIERRLMRAVIVAVGAFALAAWVIVPLLAFRDWTAINEFLQNGPDANSYGAPTVLRWLGTGELFDDRRFPVLTIFVGLGVLATLFRWRTIARARAIVLMFALSVVLFFGRRTLGAAMDVLPGNRDIFERRFIIGVHLSGLLLAGYGAVALASACWQLATRWRPRLVRRSAMSWRSAIVAGIALAALVVGVTAPMWSEVRTKDMENAAYIALQRQSAKQESDLDRLVAITKRMGGGRVYAGLSSSGWGEGFLVGVVPVSEYLASDQVDEVGFTNRTASLMADPENDFDESNSSDFDLFGIRFLIYPPSHPPPPGALLLRRAGPYELWELPDNSYFQVVDTVGPPLRVDRAHTGADTLSFLDSPFAGDGLYPVVSFGGRAPATPTLRTSARPAGAPGSVIAQSEDLAGGVAKATVVAKRTAVVLLKVSFDPGWSVTVDGHRQRTEIIAPVYVGVRVGRGRHVIVFRYHGYGDYPLLFSLAALALLALGLVPRFARRWGWFRAAR